MDNRERLLTCALDLFSRRGYDTVGVREVVEAAGVTKPTLYHYFDSKRGLLEALLRREAGRLQAELRRAAGYEHDLVLTLMRTAGAYFEFARQNPDFYRLQLALSFAPPENEAHGAMLPFLQDQQQVLEDLFFQAAEDHGNLRGRQSRYAAGFIGAVNAPILLFLNQGLALTEAVRHQTVHQFMHGIFS
jgi:TetR/AcrR family transcriptional regulator